MRYEHITLECIEGVATITINRPEVLNALSMQTEVAPVVRTAWRLG
jgi:enoyl-CoA hydratase/carnithine racemase